MTQPINVLHVIDSLAMGGAERILVELVNNFHRETVFPFVGVTRSDLSLAQAIEENIEIFQLNRRRTWDRRGLRLLGQIIRNSKIDIVHAHGYSSSRFVAAAKAYNLLSTPLIMHAHSSDRPHWGTRLVARMSTSHFIGVAPQLLEWAHTLLGFSKDQTTLLGNAINPAIYFEAQAIEVGHLFNPRPRSVGLVIANARPVKDFETLFRALASLKLGKEIGILVAGSTSNRDYLAHCRRLLTELDLTEQVVFLGPRGDLPQLLASVDFCLLSSKQESGPIALLEYMAGAKPFVVTRVGQIGESVANAGLLGLVRPEDPQGFAESLNQLLGLPMAEQRARGLAGRGLLLERFTIENGIRKLEKVYQSLLIHGSRSQATRAAVH